MPKILAIPTTQQLTTGWVAFLFFGTILGFQLREAVAATHPGHILVGLDWGIIIGALSYYTYRIIYG